MARRAAGRARLPELAESAAGPSGRLGRPAQSTRPRAEASAKLGADVGGASGRSARNGPCSGRGRKRGDRPPPGGAPTRRRRGTRSVISTTASGDPSWSCSTSRLAPAGNRRDRDGERDWYRPRSAGRPARRARRPPRGSSAPPGIHASGANAPEVISSSSPSCSSPGVQAGQSANSRGQLIGPRVAPPRAPWAAPLIRIDDDSPPGGGGNRVTRRGAESGQAACGSRRAARRGPSAKRPPLSLEMAAQVRRTDDC